MSAPNTGKRAASNSDGSAGRRWNTGWPTARSEPASAGRSRGVHDGVGGERVVAGERGAGGRIAEAIDRAALAHGHAAGAALGDEMRHGGPGLGPPGLVVEVAVDERAGPVRGEAAR